jgi:hypothetical protein
MRLPNLDPLMATILQNLAFIAIASLYVAIGARRTANTALFPGPRPVERWFKIWLVVIWVIGLALPIVALLVDGLIRGNRASAIGLGSYLIMVFAQVGTEVFVWKRWRNPIWVIVPCLYLPWRVWQCVWGLMLLAGTQAPLSIATLVALLVLWVINIGVHFTNVPLTLRWDYHPIDATFPALRNPNVFAQGAQDAEALRTGPKLT